MDMVVDRLCIQWTGDIRDFPAIIWHWDWKEAKSQKEKEVETAEKRQPVRLNDKRKMEFQRETEFGTDTGEKKIAGLCRAAQIEELLCSGTLLRWMNWLDKSSGFAGR